MKTCRSCGRRWPWHEEDCGRIAARYPAELYRGEPPSEPVDTSQAAAESIKADANSLRQQVYDYLSGLWPLDSTDDAGEVVLGMCHQTYSARRRELYLQGADGTHWLACHIPLEDLRRARPVRPAGEFGA